MGEICTRHCGFCSVGKGKPGALEIVLDVLRFVDFDVATIGQYLQPTRGQLPIEKDYTPEEFAEMRSKALSMGFRHVESGPFVRSSYHAKKHVEEGSGRRSTDENLVRHSSVDEAAACRVACREFPGSIPARSRRSR